MKSTRFFSKCFAMLMAFLMCVNTIGMTVFAAEVSETSELASESSTNEGIIPRAAIHVTYPSTRYAHLTVKSTSLSYRGTANSNNDELLWLRFYNPNNGYKYSYSFLLDGQWHTQKINMEAGVYTISEEYLSEGNLDYIQLNFEQ